MGLISAGVKAVSGTFKDQWKDYFYCDALSEDVLLTKGKNRSKGHDNVISDGSVIAVADGQCMLIVEQGQVVELCAEPGEFIYQNDLEPSFFAGRLTEGIKGTWETIKERWTFGGHAGKDQRVYYVNLKEITGNKFGTANPIPFRVVDARLGLDLDVAVRCHGVYSFQIVNPLLFYSHVAGNVKTEFTRDQIEAQMKTELVSAMQPAFAKISALQIRPYDLPGKVDELCRFLNEALTAKWLDLRGIAVASVAINAVNLPSEDEALIKNAQKAAILVNPSMAAATLVEAQAQAMQNAAANSAGAMTGFMGMNMAGQGGVDVQKLYAMNDKKQTSHWTCSCGTVNEGHFCTQCGKPKPIKGWVCSCGAVNQGRFCAQCGKPKPQNEPLYRCDKCGWEPEDPSHPPKFCPQCGDPFDDNDRQ